MLRVSIIIFGVLAIHAEGGYDYQQPGVPFQLTNENYPAPTSQQFAQNEGQRYDTTVSYTLSNQQYNSQNQYRYDQVHNTGYQPNHVVTPHANLNNYNNGYNYQTNNNYNANEGPQYQNYYTANIQPVKPIITKHIYFHVPPPDVEEKPVVPINKKKTYNIVFIKVPSQQPRYSANLQGLSSNVLAPVEDKTLIYVLVRKPEDQQPISKPSTPNHEVFYVKYKGNPDSVATYINNGASQVNSVQSLQPGLVNGRN